MDQPCNLETARFCFNTDARYLIDFKCFFDQTDGLQQHFVEIEMVEVMRGFPPAVIIEKKWKAEREKNRPGYNHHVQIKASFPVAHQIKLHPDFFLDIGADTGEYMNDVVVFELGLQFKIVRAQEFPEMESKAFVRIFEQFRNADVPGFIFFEPLLVRLFCDFVHFFED